jgi:hypothetical protein
MQLSIQPMLRAMVPGLEDASPLCADVWEARQEKTSRGFPALCAYIYWLLPETTELLSACQRCLRFAISAPIGLLLAVVLSVLMTGPSYGEECNPNNPQPGELCGIGRYLRDSEELRLRILSLREQIDSCGNCGDRDALEQEFNAAVEQRNTTRKGEGILLGALGLPGDNFEDFLYKFRTAMPDRPPELREFDEQLRRTVLNYCLISTHSDEEDRSCTLRYFNSQTTQNAAEAAQICYEKMHDKVGDQLHKFPPPDADPAVLAKHRALWLEYESCIKKTNAYEGMRTATNEACDFKNLGANLSETDFICACRGFPSDRKAACPANPKLPQPVVPTFDFQDEPVSRMLDPNGYGATLMGVRLGQPTAAAEQEIRKRMKVASVYELPTANHHFFGGAFGAGSTPELWPVEFGGRLYVNSDGTQLAAVMTVPNLPGRVFSFAYASFVPAGHEKEAEAELITAEGPPTYHEEGPSNHDFWGITITPDGRHACLPPWGAPVMEDWHRVEGAAAIVSKLSPSIADDEFGREFGLYGKLDSLLHTYTSNDDSTMYQCPSFLFASFEQTGSRDLNDTKHELLDAPALVTGKLLDPALLRWYEIQQHYDKEVGATRLPVAPY